MTFKFSLVLCSNVEKIIEAFDANGDGEIDYDEFLLLVCRRILREKAHEERGFYFPSSFDLEVSRFDKNP